MEKEILQKCSVCEQVDCFCAHGGHSRNSCRDICEWGGGQTAEETTKAFIGKRQKALVSNKLSNNLQLYTSSPLYTCSEANGEMKTWKFWAPKWILHQWPLCLTLQTHSTATDWLSLQKRSPTQSVQLPCQVGQQPYRPSFFIRPKNPFHITFGLERRRFAIWSCRSVQNFKGNERLMMVHSPPFVHFFDYGKSRL